jgi:hypothetical protein
MKPKYSILQTVVETRKITFVRVVRVRTQLYSNTDDAGGEPTGSPYCGADIGRDKSLTLFDVGEIAPSGHTIRRLNR